MYNKKDSNKLEYNKKDSNKLEYNKKDSKRRQSKSNEFEQVHKSMKMDSNKCNKIFSNKLASTAT
jgi:hypothetical protein